MARVIPAAYTSHGHTATILYKGQKQEIVARVIPAAYTSHGHTATILYKLPHDKAFEASLLIYFPFFIEVLPTFPVY